MSFEPPDLLHDLTPSQRAAVEYVDGPLLILAGPGSGKTRVITRRIAFLMAQGVPAHQILAITFTNKAANEMAKRVQAIVPGARVWVSTFHRFCARLLRQYGQFVGLQSNFSILDTNDQRQAMRRVLQDLDLDPLYFPPEKVAWRISTAKNDLITPEIYRERYERTVADHWQAAVSKAYPAYQKWLLDSNAVDFDDLLLHVALMLAEQPELRSKLDARYRYILVDEYQDANMAQYQIVAAMSQRERNLCVTGDPDQSIYGWRGARIENILRFERDFPEAKVIRLEQNFRSTKSILRAADSLIVHNAQRKHKELTTENQDGKAVQHLRFDDSRAEADGIGALMQELLASEQRRWSDFAIFYRVNSLSRELELAFTRLRIPYQVAAGVAFYDRVEIRDLLAYLRLVENPSDQAAFLRVVNRPLRGLGKTSQDRLMKFVQEQGIPVLEAAKRSREIPKLSKKAIIAFRMFAEMMEGFSLANSGSVGDLLTKILTATRYAAAWEGVESEDAVERLGNINELIAAARQYDEAAGAEVDLQGFLEQTALISDTDRIDEHAGRVTLMTLHAAKGLEFPVVFIIGLEDGLLPHERSKRENDVRQIEEERRLLFVGMTRAEDQLFLTESRIRSMHGRTMPTIPSPFALELECERSDRTSDEFPVITGWKPNPSEPHDDTDRFDEEDLPDPPPPEQRPVAKPPQFRLTTGAALLSGESASVSLPKGFGIGERVRHPRYGRGVVTEVGGYGARRTVTVLFSDDDRTETFIAAKAPLQPLS